MLSKGRSTFTLQEAYELTGGSRASTQRALSRLRSNRLVFSPARGFWVIVQPRFRAWGAVPPSDFIAPMMELLRREYYVALLSAAAVHGAHEPRPELLQVMCAPSMRTRSFGPVELAFMTRRRIDRSATILHGDPPIRVSSTEMTAIDVVERSPACGGLARVAEILQALGDLDGKALADLARDRGRTISRRAGWMIETFGRCTELDDLQRVAQHNSGNIALLDPRGESRGEISRRWGIRINTDLDTPADGPAAPA